MNRGEVWRVRFDPTIGQEIQKTRPAVIINRDGLGGLNLRVVVPITEWQPAFASMPWMVRLLPSWENGLEKPSAANAFQVKSVSTERLLNKMGQLSAEELVDIVAAVGIVIDHP